MWPLEEAPHLTNDSEVSCDHRLLILNIFQRQLSNLCKVLSSPKRLANELVSAGLVANFLIDDIESRNSTRYENSDQVFQSIRHCLESSKEFEQKFKTFCDALGNHGDPAIKEIADEMNIEYSKVYAQNVDL